ncbi:Carboxymuconolactone decarboxylase family protein [Rubripirellula amarantea]|uniref:Carboxymuconolactone decarboxylase family protein n=1 Tax=Rubripirellula amarantea TaxID=2527999 RepID=A0A5C5WJC2_9BACT|nr:carboxymuconolactone decarboxylase family protein [Rubripirellula amarantea]TWT50876.1 Carboxymuconolactone decarboxylase family protein [Rubripirellula amarantea]
MSRLETIDPAQATGRSKELLDSVKAKLGMTPNLMRVMANSPAVLDAYLKFSGALSDGELPATTREQIALAIAQANSCDYCLSAHAAVGKMVGLTADQVRDARRGTATQAKENAILGFATAVIEKRGFVSDADIVSAREAGASDAEIAEVVANAALSVFTNYLNHVAQTSIDFPQVEKLDPQSSQDNCGCHTDACSVA